MDTNLFKDTNDPIEDKKKENASGGNNLNWKKFTVTFFGHFLVTICFFTVVIGACGLYTAKVAHSNILPTKSTFAPYTSTDYGLGSSDSNISAPVLMNIIKGRSWKGFNFFDDATGINAQKATFIKEDFNDNGIFNFFCEMKPFTETNENFARIAYYLRKLFINGIASSFDMINNIYSLLYSLPEWLLMLIYFTIFPFIFTFLIFWNMFKTALEAVSYLIKLPFRVNNPDLNKDRNHAGINFKHVDTDQDDPTSQWWRKWTKCESDEYSRLHTGIWGTITEFMDYIGYGIMFMIYLTITLYAFVPISFFATIFGLFNPLRIKYKLEGDPKDKENGLGDFIRDTFVYKKTFIIFLAAYNLLMTTGVYLSKGYTFSCFVGLLILALYFEVFSIPDSDKIYADDSTQLKFNSDSDLSSKLFKPLDQVLKTTEPFCEDKAPYVTASGVENKSTGKTIDRTLNTVKRGIGRTMKSAKELKDNISEKATSVKRFGRNVTAKINNKSSSLKNKVIDAVDKFNTPKSSSYTQLDDSSPQNEINFGPENLGTNNNNNNNTNDSFNSSDVMNPLVKDSIANDNDVTNNAINSVENIDNDVTNNAINKNAETVMNPMFQDRKIGGYNGLKKTKGGALHKKYNFSLI